MYFGTTLLTNHTQVRCTIPSLSRLSIAGLSDGKDLPRAGGHEPPARPRSAPASPDESHSKQASNLLPNQGAQPLFESDYDLEETFRKRRSHTGLIVFT